MKNNPTSKTILVLAVILALALIAFIFLNHHADHNVTPVQVPETVPLPSAAQWPSTKVSDKTITDNSSYYTIKAVYPVTKDDVITNDFKTFIDNSVTQFKSDTSWAAGSGANAAPAEEGSLSLGITYTNKKTANADNYVFSTDTYTGGAHDLEATTTFSFSSTGQQITLDSLFTNGTDGLKTIAPYVAAQLAKTPNADSSMIAGGTTPTADNYQSFTVQPDGITFTFDPYQVAPYAEGTQTVTVPLAVFKAIANKNLFSTQ